jgi:magnesium chelatase family protein
VVRARQRQLSRQGAPNAQLGSTRLEEVVDLSSGDRSLLVQAAKRWGLSARAYHRVLRVARSIADLDDSTTVSSEHLAEALAYRIVDFGHAHES